MSIRRPIQVMVRLVVCISFIACLPELAAAHSPHHVITDIAASPEGTSDADVFILIADQVFRGDAGGRSWKNLVNGLDTQFVFTSIVLSPDYQTDQTVYVSTAGDGVYRSVDRGFSWQAVNLGLGRLDITKIWLPTGDAGPRGLLAASASGGVWRLGADDQWQIVLTERVRITAFAVQSSADERQRIYAGDASGKVWRSTDGGRLWEISYELAPDLSITSIAAADESVYIGTTADGLYHSTDAGLTFRRIDNLQSIRYRDCHGDVFESPGMDNHITSVTIAPNGNDLHRIFVTSWYDGVFVSDDEGESWSKWDEGLSCDEQADDMHEAHFRRLAIGTDERGDPVYWLGAFDGLFRGTGESPDWQQMETLPLGLIKGMATTGGGESLTVALATYGGGFYLTPDRGSTWTVGNKGLQTTRLTGIAFSPYYRRDGVIYGGASRRLLRSSDRGQSWQRIDLRITSFSRRLSNKLRSWGLPTGWLENQDTSQVYPTILATTPNDDDKIWFATRFHGVMGYQQSTESIVSLWSETRENINTFEMSPNFDEDKTLFASIRGSGAIRSEDGGNNWIAINDGLEFVDEWADDPEGGNFRRDVILAVSPDFKTDKRVYAGSPAGDGLFVSNDRGASWDRVDTNRVAGSITVLAIALSPQFSSDRTMLVSIKGRGVFRSTDAGETWVPVGAELHTANASIELLSFSQVFSADKTVIAASDEFLFISEDSGDSWIAPPRPVRYEDMRDVVKFSGAVERQQNEDYSALTETFLTGSGSSARLKFVGTGVRWIGSRGDRCSGANVFVDGRSFGEVSCYSEKTTSLQTIFEVNGLSYGPHEIEVQIGSGDDSASVGIDAFEVVPSSVPVDR